LAALFKRLSKTSPRVNIVRVFEDGDFVFAHTEYDFANRNIGFEIFRFENSQAVEHWDNIQKRMKPNANELSMVDGVSEVSDHASTEFNRGVIKQFVENVLIKGCPEQLPDYINPENYREHNPNLDKDLSRFGASVCYQYERCHRVLAEGNFVLSVCEGDINHIHSSFFDLYRLENEKIVEHWDTIEAIPPRSEWKNNNGKF